MDESDTEGWARVQEIAPWVVPSPMDNGAGMTKENPVTILGYGYPVVSYADQSAESIYAYVKAMDETFDDWVGAAANLHNWGKDSILIEPFGVPVHEGTIKFLEEQGLWTEEYQKKNEGLIERSKKLKEAWDQTVEKAKQESISEKDFPEYWMKMKDELVK